MGATKALTGGREITEKLIPAVARLAQVSYPADPDEHRDHDDPGDHGEHGHVMMILMIMLILMSMVILKILVIMVMVMMCFQDGSLEARIYAKMTLKLLMEHADFDRVLKKNVTANTLRNLEKILDSVRNGGMSSASSRKRRLTSNGRATAPNRGKTL